MNDTYISCMAERKGSNVFTMGVHRNEELVAHIIIFNITVMTTINSFSIVFCFCSLGQLRFYSRTPAVWTAFLCFPLRHFLYMGSESLNLQLEVCCGIWFPPSGIVTEVPQSLPCLITVYWREEKPSTVAGDCSCIKKAVSNTDKYI